MRTPVPAFPRSFLTLSFTASFRPAQLRKMKGSEQAAAICFRTESKGIRFLLVRTGSGRWTFPKGSIESGLTHAQAAALEAFEEAGVHGRMEKACFASYIHPQSKKKHRKREGQTIVHAHLCEVLRLERPKEHYRKPAWFSPEKTKRRLQKDRSLEQAQELIRVVDLALLRIRALAGVRQGKYFFKQVSLEAPGNRNLAKITYNEARSRSRRMPAVLDSKLVLLGANGKHLLPAACEGKGMN